MEAYLKFWGAQPAGAVRGVPAGQPPRCQLLSTHPMSPWRLWQEVHAWGGPEEVAAHKVRARLAWGGVCPHPFCEGRDVRRRAYCSPLNLSWRICAQAAAIPPSEPTGKATPTAPR